MKLTRMSINVTFNIMNDQLTFLQLFRKYINYHEKAFNHFDKRDPVTIQAYYNRYCIVQEFLKERNSFKIGPLDFTITLANKFFNWLCERNYSHNYCVRVVETSRLALEYGAANEFIKFNPLSSLRLKKMPPKRPVYLTEEEVIRMERCSTLSSMHEKAKDMFLFQCYTGLDYSDLIKVGKQDIRDYRENRFIEKDRNKTDISASIPYTPKVEALFKKHNYSMRLLSNPVYNEALKDLAVDACIDKHLTSHVGRKTYAMTMLNCNLHSMEAVSRMLGHKSVKTTETYYAQANIELVYRDLQRVNQQKLG